jgi:CheY-like chemotaxis protein
VFELFMQVDTSLTRSATGLGIGLGLVKQLVMLHGGTVEAHSEGVGKGSEFIVRLPVITAGPALSAANERDNRPATIAGGRILIVDDNHDAATSIATLLALDGIQVEMAFDGIQAMTAAESFRPDAILLDIGLPKLNGYQVARGIREQSWGKDILLIALTGWGQIDDRNRTREAGFDHHLVKPVDLIELVKLLGNVAPKTN